MYILGYFLIGIAEVIDILLTFYMFIIIGRAIISWVSADPYNPIVRFLITATEPVLYPIRRRLPLMGGIDLSPLILILGIVFLKSFLVHSLLRAGSGLQ